MTRAAQVLCLLPDYRQTYGSGSTKVLLTTVSTTKVRWKQQEDQLVLTTMWNLPLHIRVGRFHFLNLLNSKQSSNILRNHIWTSATFFHTIFQEKAIKLLKKKRTVHINWWYLKNALIKWFLTISSHYAVLCMCINFSCFV